MGWWITITEQHLPCRGSRKQGKRPFRPVTKRVITLSNAHKKEPKEWLPFRHLSPTADWNRSPWDHPPCVFWRCVVTSNGLASSADGTAKLLLENGRGALWDTTSCRFRPIHNTRSKRKRSTSGGVPACTIKRRLYRDLRLCPFPIWRYTFGVVTWVVESKPIWPLRHGIDTNQASHSPLVPPIVCVLTRTPAHRAL